MDKHIAAFIGFVIIFPLLTIVLWLFRGGGLQMLGQIH